MHDFVNLLTHKCHIPNRVQIEIDKDNEISTEY